MDEDRKDLATRPDNMALAEQRPSFVTGAAGTEDIGRDDIKLPRLAIAQGLSPQMIPGDSAYLDGLKLFQFFNDLTGEIYGSGPLKFVAVRRDVKRIEFDPNDRKIPVDLNVPANVPRNNWTKDAEGKGVPPRATKFVEFVALLLKDGQPPEPIVISVQESNKFNKKANERLSGFIKMRQPPAPIYAGLYETTVGVEKNDEGTFGVWRFDNAGKVVKGAFVQDEPLYRQAERFHEELKGKTISVDRVADPDSFDTDAMDAAAATGM